MTDESEISKAARDAFVHGTGFMRDGKHVPVEDVYMTAKEAAAEYLVKRLRLYARRLNEFFEPSFAQPYIEAADFIEQLISDNKELEAALREAAGYISTKEGHTDQHPQDVYDWIVSAALGEKKNG